MGHGLKALKGHGTENDFILLPDLDAMLSLSASLVRALCDRRAGIGADGVLRVVRTERATEPDVLAQAGAAEYFMDYHNADGSIAEMCGNGVRLFGRYLQHAGLIEGPVVVATRGGTKSLSFDGDDVVVEMGLPRSRPETPAVTVTGSGTYQALAIDLPNPHVIVELGSVAELLELDLSTPPVVLPPLPEGQNVEFFVRTGTFEGTEQLRMRVHERGVGETRSCGTGICAVMVAAAGLAPVPTTRWQVTVPGGSCTLWWTADGGVVMSGPAVLVADLYLDEDWLAEHR